MLTFVDSLGVSIVSVFSFFAGAKFLVYYNVPPCACASVVYSYLYVQIVNHKSTTTTSCSPFQ